MKAALGVVLLAVLCSPDNTLVPPTGRLGVGSGAIQGSDLPFLLTQPLPKSGVGVVWVQLQGDNVLVEVEGQPRCDNLPDPKPQLIYEMRIQVWVLRANGTTLAPHGAPTHVAVGHANCDNPMQFSFTPVPNENPVAVVLSVDGKLTVTQINNTPTVRAGVASTVHGRSVLAMSGPMLAAGTTLTLVTPDVPQKVHRAHVVRAVADDAYMKVRTPGPYYEIASGEAGQPLPALAVAVVGDPPVNGVADAVSLHIDDSLQDLRARVCSSMEGLHLTLWSGEPLKAPRVWHLYYYLGYDLQQTCQPGDTGDGGIKQ